MQRRTFLLALPPALSSFAAEAPANQLTAAEKKRGWRLLFNGESLEQWEDPQTESPKGDAWSVADGCIKTKPHARLREDLIYRGEFTSYELAFEWRISPGGNSGVKYLIQDRAALVKGRLDPNAKKFEDTVEYELRNRKSTRQNVPDGAALEEYTVGFEYQTIDDTSHPDAKKSADRRTGALYSLVEPQGAKPRAVGEFNQSRLIVRGLNVEHWLNGTRVVATQLQSPAIAQRLAERWPKDSRVYELLTKIPKRKAPFALQHHVDEVWFRNLKLLTSERRSA